MHLWKVIDNESIFTDTVRVSTVEVLNQYPRTVNTTQGFFSLNVLPNIGINEGEIVNITSTLTIITSAYLNGTVISCEDALSTQPNPSSLHLMLPGNICNNSHALFHIK